MQRVGQEREQAEADELTAERPGDKKERVSQPQRKIQTLILDPESCGVRLAGLVQAFQTCGSAKYPGLELSELLSPVQQK